MENPTSLLNLAADNIRVLAVSMVERAKSGHPGGAMGGADFINVLYSEFLTYDPAQPTWECRDRFFLDPGHMSPMLYAQLALIGRFTLDELKTFRQWGSVTPGHPEKNFERGVENTSGPVIRDSRKKKSTLTFPMAACRKRSRRAPDVWRDISDWTTSSCSSTLTKFSSPRKRLM